MELPEDDLNDLVTAAFLHDVGKVLVLPDLVNATQTDTGRGEKKKEARMGGLRVSAQRIFFWRPVNETVYQHHEWYNGGGYPSHLKAGNCCAMQEY